MASLLGCSDDVAVWAYTCWPFDSEHRDALGNLDPCHDRDPRPKCPACVPQGGTGFFQNPVLLWFGAKGEAPAECPRGSTYSGTYYAELDAPDCGCECAPSTGSCAVPTEFTAHAAICQELNQNPAQAGFDAPANWTGACTPANPIQPGADCGGEPCVQSLSSEPISVAEEQCLPLARLPGAPRYQKEALVCAGEVEPACEGEDEGKYCAPAAPGFQHCIYTAEPDRPCPDAYPTRYVLYETEKPKDDRWCSPCDCGPPVDSMCTAALSVFQDDACGVPVFKSSIASTGPGCTNIMPPGLALGSKQITDVAYHPGSCMPSGGETMGGIDPLGSPYPHCCGDPEIPIPK